MAAAYTLKNSDAKADGSLVYGFKVGEYDRAKALIIDPLPKPQATLLGGTSENRATSVVVSAAVTPNPLSGTESNVYVVGYTKSEDFKIGGASEHEYGSGGNLDIFVAKLDQDLKNLISIAFIGGSNDDFGNSVALDSQGNVYVTGYSSSSDFPGITNPRGTYAFILQLSGDLSSLLHSSRIALPGTNADYANSIAIDPFDNIYVAGYTILHSNNVNAFVSKHRIDLSLVGSKQIGGTGSDYAYSVAVAPTDFIYITGGTTSSDFYLSLQLPTTAGAYDKFNNGGLDAFVVKLDENLKIWAATLLGGTDNDVANSIAVSQTGDVYIAGWTASNTFPTTAGAFATKLGGTVDAFVSKFNPDLSTLLASTLLGGTKSEQANAIVLDDAGNVYVTGWTSSDDFPTSDGTTLDGGEDVFISHLDGNLSALLESTLVGGMGDDVANGISLDNDGNVLVVGYTNSINFITPQIDGGFDTVYHGSWDAFVYKASVAGTPGSKTFTIEATAPDSGGTIFPSGSVAVSQGGNIRFSITPDPGPPYSPSNHSPYQGFFVEDVLADGTSVGPVASYEFENVTENHTITVQFTQTKPKAPYTVISTANSGGTINPFGIVKMSPLYTRRFNIKPNKGFYILDVTVDGLSKGPFPVGMNIFSYPLTKVTASHTIEAIFAPKPAQ